MPIRFHIEFECESPACKTMHDMSLLDWGAYALARKQLAKKGDVKVANEDVIAEIKNRLDAVKRNPHLILGNTKAHPENFSIVGTFSPPRAAPASQEPRLL